MLPGAKVFSLPVINTAFSNRLNWLRRLLAGTAVRPSLLLIGLAAIASLITIGYRFAVWDQLLYLSFVDRYFQPILDHPGDLYISHFLWHSYTTFWMLLYPLKQLFGWEWPLFVTHLVVKFFIFWGVWALALALTKDRLTAWLSVLFTLLNKTVVNGGVNFYMADTITRYVVVPVLLFGLKNLWERNYLGAALLFGLGVQIHVLSAVYWLLAIAFSLVFDRLFNGPAAAAPMTAGRPVARAWGLFLLLALPILIWSGVADWGVPRLPPPAEVIDFIHNHHGYAFFADYDPTTWASLLFIILIIGVAARQLPANQISRRYLPLALGIVAVLFIHYLAADVFFYQPILKFQMIRSVDLLILLAMIGAAQILAGHARRGGVHTWLAAGTAAFFLVGTVIPGGNAALLTTATVLLLLLVLEPQPGRFTIPAFIIVTVFIGAQLWGPAKFGTGSLRRTIWMPLTGGFLGLAALFFAGWFATLANRRAGIRTVTFGACLTGLILLVAGGYMGFVEIAASNRAKLVLTNSQHWERLVRRTQDNLDWPGPGLQSDWIQFQLWIRDHTPAGTMFFVPPGLNGFRVFSQRNAFFEGYDCEPAIFDTAYAVALLDRMKVFGYSTASASSHSAADSSAQMYSAIKPADWQDLAHRWDVSYLITSRPANLPFAKLYQRGDLTLWRIP